MCFLLFITAFHICQLSQVCSFLFKFSLYLLISSAYNISYWERLIKISNYECGCVCFFILEWRPSGMPSLPLTLEDTFQWHHLPPSLPAYNGLWLLCFSEMLVFPSPVYFPMLWHKTCPLGHGWGVCVGGQLIWASCTWHIYLNVPHFWSFGFLPLNFIREVRIAQLHSA